MRDVDCVCYLFPMKLLLQYLRELLESLYQLQPGARSGLTDSVYEDKPSRLKYVYMQRSLWKD